MKILLACSAGMSTSLLERNIKNYMDSNGINGIVEAHGSEVAKTMIGKFDVVLLGPQVRFMLKSFKELSGNVPVDVIPPVDYATAKGESVYKFAESLVK